MSKGGSVELRLGVSAVQQRDGGAYKDVKDSACRQREKIGEIGKVLREAGFVTVDEQACALGLGRSTTWMILQAEHKTSGLHAELICRMLAHKKLPLTVRLVIRQYVIEKARGEYGHSLGRRRRFAANFWDIPELAELLKR